MRPFRLLILVLVCLGAPAATAQQKLATRYLTFLHINDVYEVWPKRGVGGLAELGALVKQERKQAPDAVMTLGGDLISPSLLSSLTKGRHMIRFMNRLGLNYAVLGNHEFDFGLPVLLERIKESEFKWLAANVTGADGKLLPGVAGTAVREIAGIKVGFVGLVTPESRIYIRGNVPVKFGDIVDSAKTAVAALREQGAQVIVALTHLGMREDLELARKVPAIHLILGGHDHNAINVVAGRTLIFKVGSDAAWLGVVRLAVTPRKGRSPVVTPSWRMIAVRGVTPDPELRNMAQSYEDRLKERLGQVIGKLATEMSSESNLVRSRETAIGNLIADAVRASVDAEVALINGGGIRGNRRYRPNSNLTARHILGELPFNNTIVVLALKGSELKAALEYGISGVNAGRFPQVSGIKVVWEPVRPKGNQIVSIEIGGKPLDPKRRYRVATVDFLADGGDGYAMLKDAPRVVTAQNGPRITQAVIKYIRLKKTVAPRVDGRLIAK